MEHSSAPLNITFTFLPEKSRHFADNPVGGSYGPATEPDRLDGSNFMSDNEILEQRRAAHIKLTLRKECLWAFLLRNKKLT